MLAMFESITLKMLILTYNSYNQWWDKPASYFSYCDALKALNNLFGFQPKTNNKNVITGSIQTKIEGYFIKQPANSLHERQGKAEGLF